MWQFVALMHRNLMFERLFGLPRCPVRNEHYSRHAQVLRRFVAILRRSSERIRADRKGPRPARAFREKRDEPQGGSSSSPSRFFGAIATSLRSGRICRRNDIAAKALANVLRKEGGRGSQGFTGTGDVAGVGAKRSSRKPSSDGGRNGRQPDRSGPMALAGPETKCRPSSDLAEFLRE